ncbi:hypothetical protein HID58_087159, partial [Brassica napus]
TRLHESSCSILAGVVPKAPRLLNLSFSSLIPSRDEIRSMIFKLNPNKAPGPEDPPQISWSPNELEKALLGKL